MENIDRLAIRVLSDSIPNHKNRTFYCFAHNDINIECMAKSVKNIINDNDKIFILDNKSKMSGVSNSSIVSKQYEFFNINTNKIPYDKDSINTKIESNAVIEWAKKNNIKDLIICAPPFHILRAFMTIVSSAIDINYKINIYTLSGLVDNWRKITISHQGLNKTSFNNFIKLELDRISIYNKKGDIKNANIIWDYLMRRL